MGKLDSRNRVIFRKSMALFLAIIFFISLQNKAGAVDDKWSFAMFGDTQQGDEDNPGSNGVSTVMMAKAINDIVTKGIDVDLVLEVGDVTEGDPANITRDAQRSQFRTWKNAMSYFYNNGKGVYPVRGNHEGYAYGFDAVSAWRAEFGYLPSNGPSGDEKQTYSYTNENAKFLAIDMYDTRNFLGVGIGYKEDDLPQSWINSQLNSSQEHKFVYAHEPMFGRSHDDGYTGSDRTNFLNSLASANVGVYISGHDHQHSRSAIINDNGEILTQQLVLAACGEKTYGYHAPTDSHDVEINHVNGQVGYYIADVEGPKVTITFHATEDSSSNTDFYIADQFSYFSNGKQYLVRQGQSYAGKSLSINDGDGYVKSSANIVGGTNTDKTEVLAMGWRTSDNFVDKDDNVQFASSVLEICGIENQLLSKECENFGLSFDIDQDDFSDELRIAWWDEANNDWLVLNDYALVYGSYDDSYGLGTMGIDWDNFNIWGIFGTEGAFGVVMGSSIAGVISGDPQAVPEPGTLAVMLAGLSLVIAAKKRNRKSEY